MIIIISNLSDLIYTIIQFEGILNGAALLHPLYGRHRSKMDGALTGSQSKELMFISSGWGGERWELSQVSRTQTASLFDSSVKSISADVDGYVRIWKRVRSIRQLAQPRKCKFREG